jgi:hypothetical protein
MTSRERVTAVAYDQYRWARWQAQEIFELACGNT